MSSGNVLTLKQICILAQCSERDVRNDLRRGVLPSQELDVVREWLRGRWERDTRKLIREELSKLN